MSSSARLFGDIVKAVIVVERIEKTLARADSVRNKDIDYIVGVRAFRYRYFYFGARFFARQCDEYLVVAHRARERVVSRFEFIFAAQRRIDAEHERQIDHLLIREQLCQLARAAVARYFNAYRIPFSVQRERVACRIYHKSGRKSSRKNGKDEVNKKSSLHKCCLRRYCSPKATQLL